MPDFGKLAKALAKLRRLRKLKLLKNATKKGAVSGELMKVNKGLTKIEAKAVEKGGLVKITNRSLLKPTNAGAVSGVMTSRAARIAEERALAAGSRTFPKWVKTAGVVEDAIIVEAKKGGRAWNIAKKAGLVSITIQALFFIHHRVILPELLKKQQLYLPL